MLTIASRRWSQRGTCWVLPMVFSLAAPVGVIGQTATDLGAAIGDGRVALVSARGNGSSSGAAVEGELRNNTRAALRIGINLLTPLFLRNSGRGQNMAATQVFLSDGGYVSDGRRSFIELGPGATSSVTFTAFCLDFDRDNPSAEERLAIARMPDSVQGVMRRLTRYTIANPEADLAIAGQLAVWMAQGEGLEEIRRRFPFSSAEEALARQILETEDPPVDTVASPLEQDSEFLARFREILDSATHEDPLAGYQPDWREQGADQEAHPLIQRVRERAERDGRPVDGRLFLVGASLLAVAGAGFFAAALGSGRKALVAGLRRTPALTAPVGRIALGALATLVILGAAYALLQSTRYELECAQMQGARLPARAGSVSTSECYVLDRWTGAVRRTRGD